MKLLFGVVGMTLALATAAFAQAPTRIHGSIEKIDGSTATVKTSQGQEITLKLAPNAMVTAVAKRSASDIKDGAFVGIGGRPQPDGSIKAIQVMIFPEAMRGTGEGHRDWGVLPQTTMTNATVAATVAATDGADVTLKYKDGEKKFTIGPDAKILTLVAASQSDLKPGVEMATSATKNEDGSFTSARITVSKDGVPLPL